jgi:hypothetical protein
MRLPPPYPRVLHASACICVKPCLLRRAPHSAARVPEHNAQAAPTPRLIALRAADVRVLALHHAQRPQLQATSKLHAAIRASHGVGSALLPEYRPECRRTQKPTQHFSQPRRRVRHDRGVTPRSKEYFRHMALLSDPAIIDALVRGSSDALTLLDEVGGEMLDAAD